MVTERSYPVEPANARARLARLISMASRQLLPSLVASRDHCGDAEQSKNSVTLALPPGSGLRSHPHEAAAR